MNWDDLRYFLAVARTGSIRGAAAHLQVNHSTVSRRIDAFEKKLDVRLFERLPTGYLMTSAGETMRQSAERIEGEVLAVGRQVVGGDSRLSGLLRVTLPDTVAHKLLMPDLVAFSTMHPEIELELIISYDMVDLSRREADVAIRLSSDPPGNLFGRRIIGYAKAIYASVDYLAAHDPIQRPEELAWIGWKDTVRDPQWVLDSAFPQAPVRNRINHAIIQLEAVKAGMGLSMLACYIGDSEPGLRRVPPTTAMPDRDMWLLTHEDLRYTARVRQFMAFIADALLAKRDLLEGRCPQPPL